MTIEQVLTTTAEEIVEITEKEDYNKLINQAARAKQCIYTFLEFSSIIAIKEEASKELTSYLVYISNYLQDLNNNDKSQVCDLLELFYLNIINCTKQ
nr:hypothetical protein [uncultured Bacteroides sp.]